MPGSRFRCIVPLAGLVAALLLGGCAQTPAPTPTPGATAAASPTRSAGTATPPAATATSTRAAATASPTAAASATPTAPARATPGASATPTVAGAATPPAATTSPGPPPPDYLDDRSTPEALLQSFYNAINRHEYARAYGYWEAGAADLPPFPAFEQGYATTTAVELATGAVGGDAGAGQRYYAVPVYLTAAQTDGSTRTYAGCYVLHLATPAVQDAPPFHPLAIQAATVQPAAAGADAQALLAQACQEAGRPATPLTPTATPADPTSVTAERYLDDRSTPEAVLRSYYNAVNRREYARAYAYWDAEQASRLAPYPEFKEGYATTDTVQLTIGTIASDAGAGQWYYHAPVTLLATHTDGTTHTWVGCYTLHLGSPSAQATPPFRPLAIRSAAMREVPNDADTTQAMQHACG